MEKIKSWRKPNPHKPLFGQLTEPVPATRFFDQLSFIGNSNVGCFVLETTDGIIMIDCMEPKEEHRLTIIKGFEELGLSLENLKKIVVTHGHGDHYGTANWFREKYGCTVYMSKGDYEFAKTDLNSPSGPLAWEINDYIDDGDIVELGNQKIYCFSTPGHTPYCMSFIIPVTDEGNPHMVALWGGTGLPYLMGDKVKYLNSCLYFAKKTSEFGCDAEISTHPFIDRGTERLSILRDIPDGVPNPFVLGKEGYKYYENMFRDACISAMKKQCIELDPITPPDPRCRKR